MNYYLSQNNNVIGPCSLNELQIMWNNGIITKNDLICFEGTTDSWLSINTIIPILESTKQQQLQQTTNSHKVHTIEATGKSHKRDILIFAFLTILGTLITFCGGSGLVGGSMIIIGLIGFVVCKIFAWWDHG